MGLINRKHVILQSAMVDHESKHWLRVRESTQALHCEIVFYLRVIEPGRVEIVKLKAQRILVIAN